MSPETRAKAEADAQRLGEEMDRAEVRRARNFDDLGEKD
jgi:hypothetical protein